MRLIKIFALAFLLAAPAATFIMSDAVWWDWAVNWVMRGADGYDLPFGLIHFSNFTGDWIFLFNLVAGMGLFVVGIVAGYYLREG